MTRRGFVKTSAGGLAAGALGAGAGARADDGAAATELANLGSPDPDALAQAVRAEFVDRKMTCAESVLGGACSTLEIKSPLVPDVALGMAGGIGFQGEVCGIVSGAAMVIGLVVGSRETDMMKKRMRVAAAAGKFLQAIRQEADTLACRDICGVDLTTKTGRMKLKMGLKAEKCVPLIETGARLLAKALKDDEEHPHYEPPKGE